ncbi:cobyrinic acid a,c-diamide synthase [Desulfonema ishimotonii]|uniref:Cobyrinate a,c-diamide synthase n=1 Tax=Desulfonema ishimotonii TaxID=45657 RepID=A0A401FYJ1_9BACT|nr:cobyrinate a,c-diamide synthase [Desulfonema ishimotonii]GBC62027.1 cobyrinic acid a,c-diamide synthase [Desulfonema ishimotonii]
MSHTSSHQNLFDFPRIFIAGLRGGTGKTTLSIGIIAAWRKLGRSVAPYKKGPDYIDAGWLTLAAGRPCYNLDTFLVEKESVRHSFLSHTRPGDIAVIEGNRGLYDGIDVEGATSSAEVAKLLDTPVILCMDCTKATRTIAAILNGCVAFDPDVHISGVILNRIAGPRHEKILRENIEYHCGIPVVGAVPKLGEQTQNFPERHMGLVPTPEHVLAKNSIDMAADVAARYIDLDALNTIALGAAVKRDVSPCRCPSACELTSDPPCTSASAPNGKPRIGIIRDSAFQFYYPDNIEALIAHGAEPVFISAFEDAGLPEIDALYIGGGFPETHAGKLGTNTRFMEQLRSLAEGGLPVYAECGGLMYLGKSLIIDGKTYPMSGVLPIVFGLAHKPQGLGYTVVSVERENPYFEVGTEVRGHEFRYSQVLEWGGTERDMIFSMKRGTGFLNKRDGICHKNVFATYTHIHALGVPSWAKAMVANAAVYRQKNKGSDKK